MTSHAGTTTLSTGMTNSHLADMAMFDIAMVLLVWRRFVVYFYFVSIRSQRRRTGSVAAVARGIHAGGMEVESVTAGISRP
jgi:preprotein translocase subunit YajC